MAERVESDDGTAEINRLRRENEELRERLADAEGEGCTLHKHAPHGKEAEELRKGIEKIIAHGPPKGLWATTLQKLLDGVDARDSLAHLRANEELRDVKSANRRGMRSQAKAIEILLEGLVDGLDSRCCSTKVLRKALVALGAKSSLLPQDVPPANVGRRARRRS